MVKCKNCISWNQWDSTSKFGVCPILNNRDFVYPEVEDCMDVAERTTDFCNHSHADFGCIKYMPKPKPISISINRVKKK